MTSQPNTPTSSGVYVVAIRRDPDRDATRAAAYAHVGLDIDGLDLRDTTLATAYTDTGYTVADLITLIDHLTLLGTDPSSVPGDPHPTFEDRGGVDSEGHATDLFMLGLAPSEGNWLACAAAVHATWPRLLDLLGASIGGIFVTADGDDARIDLPGTRVPKSLRLKSGWDYDAEGNQVWLPIEEAWRRFVANNNARTAERKIGKKDMKRMRRHMEGFYADREKSS